MGLKKKNLSKGSSFIRNEGYDIMSGSVSCDETHSSGLIFQPDGSSSRLSAFRSSASDPSFLNQRETPPPPLLAPVQTRVPLGSRLPGADNLMASGSSNRVSLCFQTRAGGGKALPLRVRKISTG